MNTEKYNGWTNYETWLLNLWYGDAFSEDAGMFTTTNELADHIKQTVEEQVSEQIGQTSGFVADMVNAALSEIDWFEIAEHYEEDLAKEEEAE